MIVDCPYLGSTLNVSQRPVAQPKSKPHKAPDQPTKPWSVHETPRPLTPNILLTPGGLEIWNITSNW